MVYAESMPTERPQEDPMTDELATDRMIEDRAERAADALTLCCAPEMCPTCTDEGGHAPSSDRCDCCDTPAALRIVDEDDEDRCPECGSINVNDPSKVAEHDARVTAARNAATAARVEAARVALRHEIDYLSGRVNKAEAEMRKLVDEADSDFLRAGAYAYGAGALGALASMAAGRMDAILSTLTGEVAEG